MTFFTHTVIRGNWLTRKIDSQSAAVAVFFSLSLLFGSLLYWNGTWGADHWMAATRAAVYEKHEFWRAWTTLLVHADPRHLVSNTLLFFVLGSFVFGYFGWLAFPVLAFLTGGFTNLYVLTTMHAETELIGASGIVFWMGGFWLILYFLIDRRLGLIQRALRSIGVGLVLFMPAEAFDPGISYLSHLVGFLSGIFFGLIFYRFNREKIRRAEVREVVFEIDEEVDRSLSTSQD